ncbi:helix-turn-helix domain-containing protein [Commensalibacter melissae]|nr:helix-turn-helix transcriptional regulator [Commensalibacter melissae]
MLRIEFAQLQEQAGISIKDLANEAGFTQRTLYRWEKGEAVPCKAVMTLL